MGGASQAAPSGRADAKGRLAKGSQRSILSSPLHVERAAMPHCTVCGTAYVHGPGACASCGTTLPALALGLGEARVKAADTALDFPAASRGKRLTAGAIDLLVCVAVMVAMLKMPGGPLSIVKRGPIFKVMRF